LEARKGDIDLSNTLLTPRCRVSVLSSGQSLYNGATRAPREVHRYRWRGHADGNLLLPIRLRRKPGHIRSRGACSVKHRAQCSRSNLRPTRNKVRAAASNEIKYVPVTVF